MKKIFYLLLAFLGIILIPYFGAWFGFDGVFPPDYFQYPRIIPPAKADFSLLYFIPIAIACILVALLYIYPRIFGFKKSTVTSQRTIAKTNFPVWFWLGLIIWGVSLFTFWAKLSNPKWLTFWTDIPLYWGITITLDGIVYKLTGGKSIMSQNPREIIAIGIASIPGWITYEYLNFYLEENWYYPAGGLIPNTQFVLYAFLGASGLMPMAFEMYTLFNVSTSFRNKYILGPKIKAGKWTKIFLLLASFVGMFVTGLFPDNLFFLIWLAPPTILAITLEELGIWTPFRPIAEKGNWSPFLLFTLTYLVVGAILEAQNYVSAAHLAHGVFDYSFNPSYWQYSLPYVEKFKVFELPILGYFGYLPFAIYCWIWWIFFSYLLNIPTQFSGNSFSND